MDLFFDIGNTRIKLWWCDGSKVLHHQAIIHAGDIRKTQQEILPEWQDSPVSRILGASVLSVEMERDFIQTCQEQWQIAPQFARSASVWGAVRSAYAERPETLGIDRWLGLIASHTSQHTVCVVSCGSAFTVDVITAEGCHKGGYILPGLLMTAGMLEKGTDRVRFESLPWESITLGHTTAEAVAHGALASITALIERVVSDEQAELVLTGGAADYVLPHLRCTARKEKDLLLHGLQRYFTETDIKRFNDSGAEE